MDQPAAIRLLPQFEELAGENVIILHRLLKNSVPSREYLLMTDSYFDLVGEPSQAGLESRVETYDDIGRVPVKVLYMKTDTGTENVPAFSFAKDAKWTTRGAVRVLLRKLGFLRDKRFVNMEDQNITLTSVLVDIVHACIIQYIPGIRSKDRRKHATDREAQREVSGLSSQPYKDIISGRTRLGNRSSEPPKR